MRSLSGGPGDAGRGEERRGGEEGREGKMRREEREEETRGKEESREGKMRWEKKGE